MFILVVGVGAYLRAQAGMGENGSGWGWGGSEEISDGNPNNGLSGYETGVGWISTNSTNCDKNGNGSIDAGDAAPVGCPAIGTVVGNYGINIPLGDGAVTGYAWSGGIDNNNQGIRWIQFNPSSGYPTTGCNPAPCPATGVQRSENNLTGWARITDIATESAAGNSGGWLGWIKMSGITSAGGSYGVTINSATGALSGCSPTGTGCAWSDELGWIDFSKASTALSAPTVTLGASPDLIILAEEVSLPQNTILTWTITGTATACTASGAWSGSKTTTGGLETISVSASSNIYSIQCCNGSSCSTVANATVTAGCYNRQCSGTTCPAVPGTFVSSTSNTTGDSCEIECTSDVNCSSGSANTKWKEVAP